VYTSTQRTRPDHPVERLMIWPVATVPAEATLLEIADALAADEIGAVLVVQGPRLVGVVSERDIVSHLAAGATASHLTAADVMATDIVSIAPGDSVLAAAVTMRDAGVRHVPVLDAEARIAGIVSMRDLLDVLSRWCQEDIDVVVVPSGTRIVVGND